MTTPYGFQRWGIREVHRANGSTILAASPGLGKTIMALSYSTALAAARPIIVVCPASLKWNWAAEATRHVRMRSQVLEGTTALPPADDDSIDGTAPPLWIINYNIVYAWLDYLQALKPQILICDEGHYLASPNSRWTRAIKELSLGIPHILMLTGTPILNRPAELWSMLNILRPDLYPNFYPFGHKFCSPRRGFQNRWEFKGASNLDILHTQLKQQRLMIRIRKEDVLTQLPAKRQRVIPMELSNRSEYDHALKDFLGWLRTHKRGSLKKAEKAQQLVQMANLRRLAGTLKLPAVMEWIDNFLVSSEDKLIVFANHRDVIAQLHDRYQKCSAMVTGAVKGKDRQAQFTKFNTHPKCRLFIGNIKAAGVGWSAKGTSTVAFVEYPWNPAMVTQAADRCLVASSLICCQRSGRIDSMSLTKIEDVVVGDSVLTHTGNYRKVTAVHKRSVGNPIITTIDYVGWHEPLICTHDHKVLIKRDNQLIWVQAHQLIPSDSMVFPKEKITTRLTEITIKDEWRTHLNPVKVTACIKCGDKITARSMCDKHYREEISQSPRPPKSKQISPKYVRLPEKITIDDDWLFLFGWFAAEGFSSYLNGEPRFISFSGHIKEVPILKRLAKTISKIGVKCSIHARPANNVAEMIAYSGELARWFRLWFGHGAGNKYLPSELLNLPQDQASKVLAGYVAGDGNIRQHAACSSSTVRWISKSKTLCWHMVKLAVTAGFVPSMKIERPHDHLMWVGSYTLNASTSRKRLSESDHDFIYRPIRNIVTKRITGWTPLYDLTVEEDHSFTTGLATVHNCHGLHRGVEGKATEIVFMVAKNTIESKLLRIIQEKSKIIAGILDGHGLGESLNIFDMLSQALLEEDQS